MAAYVVADVDVTNPEAYDEYRSQVQATVDAYGGRFLTRGGAVEALEGDWAPRRLVILEFESVERAKQWIDSPEYSAIKPIRWRNANTNVLVVEGA